MTNQVQKLLENLISYLILGIAIAFALWFIFVFFYVFFFGLLIGAGIWLLSLLKQLFCPSSKPRQQGRIIDQEKED